MDRQSSDACQQLDQIIFLLVPQNGVVAINITVEFNVEAIMRDGTVLRSNVYLPTDAGRYPVLLTRLPYGKDTDTFNLVNLVRLAANGYIVVVQDCRGRYASDGVFASYVQEIWDGYDSVEWAAKLPQSDGQVGMLGTSYYGFTQWAAAAASPPSLSCITPVFSMDGQWNGAATEGGAFDWGKTALWYLQDIAPDLVQRIKKGELHKQTAIKEIRQNVESLSTQGYWTIPLADFEPLRRLGVAGEFFEQFMHPEFGDYWASRSLDEHYRSIAVPSLNIAGWYDIFVAGTIRNYKAMRSNGIESYLVVGPWSHMNRTNIVGDIRFSEEASGAMLDGKEDLTQLHQRWFDTMLKGKKELWQDEQPVKIYVMGANRWRSAQNWPLPETQYLPFYLESDGTAQSRFGTGRLSRTVPGRDCCADEYVYDPLHPVPTVGGNTLLHSHYPPGPVNQQEIEERSDMLVYTSESLNEDIEVTGEVCANLFVSTTAPDTDFVVRLSDVYPDGRSICLCDGILRMRFRESWSASKAAVPGTVYEVNIGSGVTSNLFKRGHRIRFVVTSSSFPRWNRNLNTGKSNELTEETDTACQTIYHDCERPSHVLLPVIPR